MILDEKEKDRFRQFLTCEAETAKGMMEQFEKISSGSRLDEAMTKKYKHDIAACIIVLKMLSGETMTIG